MRPLLFKLLCLFRRNEQPSEAELIAYGREQERLHTIPPTLHCPNCQYPLTVHWHGTSTWILKCQRCERRVIHDPRGQYFLAHRGEYDPANKDTQAVPRVEFRLTPFPDTAPLAHTSSEAAYEPFLNDAGVDDTARSIPVIRVRQLRKVG